MRSTFRLLAAESNLVRINKLVASQFQCSRREATAYIQKGYVRVEGQIPESPGSRYPPSINIDLDTRRIGQANRTILFNKPLGIISCQPEQPEQISAIKLLTRDRFGGKGMGTESPRNWKHKLAVAGRLDSNSTGLLVFTQSGYIASRILGNTAGLSPIEKEYLVRVGPDVQLYDTDKVAGTLERLRNGIRDQDDLLVAKSIEVQNEQQLRIVLTTGRKHQIRRMLAAVHWPAQAIKRVRIGNWTLGSLRPGTWRLVGKDESLV